MAEVHSPDVYGPVILAGSHGLAGQRVTSAGPNAQAVWSNEPVNPGVFSYASASNVTHTIVHNLNNLHPVVQVYIQGTVQAAQPSVIDAIDANTVQITFFVARAIEGLIVG